MVKIKRSFPAPSSLAEEAKRNGKYDREDVIKRLQKDFHNKCYICEMKELQDPEKYLSFHLNDNEVAVSISDLQDEVQKRTALLVTEVFSKRNTGMRTYTSDERLKLLQKEMNILYKQLEKLYKYPNSKITMRTICCLLKRESAFAAFKRCYVREHLAEYPELQKYVELDG